MAEGKKWQDPWRYTTVGLEFTAIFGMFVAAGLMLDRWLDLKPVFTVWGGIIGFAAALRQLLRRARQARNFDRNSTQQDDSTEP